MKADYDNKFLLVRNMELYWYIVVIIFIMIKIFFYICWYRSRQRQLAAYLSNPRNTQIVIVGGRAYLHQVCERQNTSIWPSWYGVQDDGSVGEPSASLPPSSSLSHLDMPPPYEAVSGGKIDSLYKYTTACTGMTIVYIEIRKKFVNQNLDRILGKVKS